MTGIPKHSNQNFPSLSWSSFRSSPLSVFDRIDKHFSGYLHRMNLGIIDYLLVIPGLICSSHCVPGIIILTYLTISIKFGIFFTISSVLTVVLTEIMKKNTQRDRPDFHTINSRHMNLRSLLTNFSFPSGDSAQSAVLAFVFYYYYSNNNNNNHNHNNLLPSELYLLIMPIVMFARVYFGCHWISDVLIGASIGATLTTIVYFIWNHFLHLSF